MTKTVEENKKETFLSIVIPVYNEEARIEQSLKALFEYFSVQTYSYKVIISDDGSTDKSNEIVRRYMKDWQELNLLENKHKGKAPALISGINSSKSKYVLFTDIDLSVPINELSKFIVWVENEGYDIAIATREGPGAERVNEPLTRHVMGRVFNMIVQLLVLPGINDTQCGFKLFRNEVAKDVFGSAQLYSIDNPEISGAKVSGFDVELLFIARLRDYRIKEVPVKWIYGDVSKVHNLSDSYHNFVDVIKVKRYNAKGLYEKKTSSEN